ncbi:MAG: hypothetical protein JO043_05355, partial [Candidatus Eremiobacteraeota bacterium]|nr:hypothetical protein [Candidatus Eremiobacteraeota bacterium]
MVKTAIDAPGELQRAAELLFKNWKLAVPTAVSSLLIGALGIFVFASVVTTATLGGMVAGHAGAGLAGILTLLPMLALYFVIAVLLTIIAQAVVIHAAEDAWEGREVDFGRSLGVAMSRLLPLIGAFIIIALLMVIPVLLAVFIIGFLLMLIVGFFVMYVLPAVVLGGASSAGSISESYRMARENLGPSLIAFAGIIVALIIGGIIQTLLHHGAILTLIAS